MTNPESSLPQIKDKMTLGEILTFFKAMDDGLIQVDPEEMVKIGAKAQVKIDGYKDFLDNCDSRIDLMKKRAAEFADTARQLTGIRDRVKQLLLFHLQHNELDSMPGTDWIVKLVTTKNKSVKELEKVEPSSQNFMVFRSFMKRSYSWDKRAIADNLKSGEPDPAIAKVFKMEDSHSLRWSVRKGIKA